jgi:hypothetical protein
MWRQLLTGLPVSAPPTARPQKHPAPDNAIIAAAVLPAPVTDDCSGCNYDPPRALAVKRIAAGLRGTGLCPVTSPWWYPSRDDRWGLGVAALVLAVGGYAQNLPADSVMAPSYWLDAPALSISFTWWRLTRGVRFCAFNAKPPIGSWCTFVGSAT